MEKEQLNSLGKIEEIARAAAVVGRARAKERRRKTGCCWDAVPREYSEKGKKKKGKWMETSKVRTPSQSIKHFHRGTIYQSALSLSVRVIPSLATNFFILVPPTIFHDAQTKDHILAHHIKPSRQISNNASLIRMPVTQSDNAREPACCVK